MSYTTKVYMKQGGDEMVVASGGKITVEAGGAIEAAEGSIIPAVETQDAIADLKLTASAEYDSTELEAVAAKVDAILAALRLAKVIEAGE